MFQVRKIGKVVFNQSAITSFLLTNSALKAEMKRVADKRFANKTFIHHENPKLDSFPGLSARDRKRHLAYKKRQISLEDFVKEAGYNIRRYMTTANNLNINFKYGNRPIYRIDISGGNKEYPWIEYAYALKRNIANFRLPSES